MHITSIHKESYSHVSTPFTENPVTRMSPLLSMAALEVSIMTTSSATSENAYMDTQDYG